jgi:hypothetical protein
MTQSVWPDVQFGAFNAMNAEGVLYLVSCTIWSAWLVLISLSMAENHYSDAKFPRFYVYIFALTLLLCGLVFPALVVWRSILPMKLPPNFLWISALLVHVPAVFTYIFATIRYRKKLTSSAGDKHKVQKYTDEVEEIRDWLWYARPFLDFESLDEEVKRKKSKNATK